MIPKKNILAEISPTKQAIKQWLIFALEVTWQITEMWK